MSIILKGCICAR